MGIAVKQAAHAIADDLLQLPGDFPSVPDEILSRFPNTAPDWQEQQQRWWTKTQNSLSEFAGTVQDGIAMGNVLTVNGDMGAIYIRNIRGDGAWADPDTPFYVNRASYFSLGSSLTWNPETKTLMVSGTIIAIAGTIGGFNIGPDYIRDAANSFGLSSVVTGGDDVRFWAGSTFAARATAPFRVYESGLMFSSGATITGAVTFASTNRVIATDDAAFLTWQGPAGASSPGFYTQQSVSGGGFSAYGVGAGSPLIGLYRSAGTYGAPSNLAANSIVATLFTQGYISGAYNEVGRLQWGTIATGNTNYFKVEVADAASANIQNWIFNYDGKLYFTAANDIFSPNSTVYPVAPYVSDPLANIYRSAAGIIKTDGSFIVGVNIGINGTLGVTGVSTLGVVNATSLAGTGAGITTISASNISSGTLSNSRLAFSVGTMASQNANAVAITGGTISGITSFSSTYLKAGVTTRVDVTDCNFSVYNGGTQNARIDYTTGFYYVQGNQVVGARGTKGAAGLTEVVALLDAWGAWA